MSNEDFFKNIFTIMPLRRKRCEIECGYFRTILTIDEQESGGQKMAMDIGLKFLKIVDSREARKWKYSECSPVSNALVRSTKVVYSPTYCYRHFCCRCRVAKTMAPCGIHTNSQGAGHVPGMRWDDWVKRGSESCQRWKVRRYRGSCHRRSYSALRL